MAVADEPADQLLTPMIPRKNGRHVEAAPTTTPFAPEGMLAAPTTLPSAAPFASTYLALVSCALFAVMAAWTAAVTSAAVTVTVPLAVCTSCSPMIRVPAIAAKSLAFWVLRLCT